MRPVKKADKVLVLRITQVTPISNWAGEISEH